MKKFKEFIKKKDDEYKPAFFGFITKQPKPKKGNKLKEAHDDWDHDHHEEDDYDEHEDHEQPDLDYDAPHHSSLSNHYHARDTNFKKGTWYKHYDVHDMESFRDYTSDSSEINASLLHNHKYSDHQIEGVKKALTKVKTPHDIEVHTGTAFSPERYKDHNHPPHENIKVHLPAFTSTSLKPSIAHGFSKHDPQHPHVYLHNDIFSKEETAPKKLEGEDLPTAKEEDYHFNYAKRIQYKYGSNKLPYKYTHVISLKVPKGSHGAYVGHKDFSEHKDEREFILHAGAKAEVHPEPTIDHKQKRVQWYGKIVHDGVKPVGEEPEEHHEKQLKLPF